MISPPTRPTLTDPLFTYTTLYRSLPDWAALLIALLLILGAILALFGSIGLLRLKSFYDRIHAPTLGTTLGIGSILIASMLFHSVLQTRLVIHELLITVFMVVTTPITQIGRAHV